MLLDVFTSDATFGPRSKEAVRICLAEGRLVVCEVVWAEVAGFFPSEAAAEAAMETLVSNSTQLAFERRSPWRQCGKFNPMAPPSAGPAQADRLLSRDRGFYRAYFTRLRGLDPSET